MNFHEAMQMYKGRARGRDVGGAVPYMGCENINHVGYNAGLMNEKRATRGRPYGGDCRKFVGQAVFFIFNFQASNKVQEVLFCAIRDFTSASPIHVDRMCPHALLPCRIFNLG